MTIKYLKSLEENNTDFDGWQNSPLTKSQINQLEVNFNNGSPFPTVLKELLFLAGDFCPYLDYCTEDSQQEFQDDVRESLVYKKLALPKPFMAVYSYIGSGGWFDMVYLDEGKNPPVYKVELKPRFGSSSTPKIHNLDETLSEYINSSIYASKAANGQL